MLKNIFVHVYNVTLYSHPQNNVFKNFEQYSSFRKWTMNDIFSLCFYWFFFLYGTNFLQVWESGKLISKAENQAI